MASIPPPSPNDPHAWLEEVLGEKQLEWAKKRNEDCIEKVGDPSKLETYKRILAIYDSKDKIPGLRRIGNDGFFYNFWKDENHVQGIWRKTTIESYRSEKPEWTTVIDVDALPPPTTGTASTWVWHGTSLLDEGPDGAWDRALVSLSPGGSDADTTREFDLSTETWVEPCDGGFSLPEPAKARVGYRTRNEVLVGTDFEGDGKSMTDSGYPRVVKAWKRGTPLSEAVVVFEGEQADISADQYAYHDRGFAHEFQRRSITFYTSKHWYRTPSDGLSSEAAGGGGGAAEDKAPFLEVPVPEDSSLGTFADQATIELRSEWAPPGCVDSETGAQKVFEAGSLLACPMVEVMASNFKNAVALFEPSPTASLQSESGTKNFLVSC
jgi:prolyl oligopeptidase